MTHIFIYQPLTVQNLKECSICDRATLNLWLRNKTLVNWKRAQSPQDSFLSWIVALASSPRCMLGSLNPDSEDSEGQRLVESATSGLIDRFFIFHWNECAGVMGTCLLVSIRMEWSNWGAVALLIFNWAGLNVHKDQEACLDSVQIRDRPVPQGG